MFVILICVFEKKLDFKLEHRVYDMNIVEDISRTPHVDSIIQSILC